MIYSCFYFHYKNMNITETLQFNTVVRTHVTTHAFIFDHCMSTTLITIYDCVFAAYFVCCMLILSVVCKYVVIL